MRRRHLTLVTILLLAAMATGPAYAQPAASNALLLAQICSTCSAAHQLTLPKAIRLAVAQHRAERHTPDAFSPPPAILASAAHAEPATPRATSSRTPHPLAFLRDSSRPNAPPAA